MSLHDPMKRIKLLCNGCVRPITTMPFYKCSSDCDFVLHDWCTRLRKELRNHIGHPQHTIELMTTSNVDGFYCNICQLPCNGFGYGCKSCNYLIDVNCGFIPEEITHEGHPNHLLTRVNASTSSSSSSSSRLSKKECRACRERINQDEGMIYFTCTSCDFCLDYRCALLLPKTIRHKYNKHPLELSYSPIEDHKSQYFCEIGEEDLDPGKRWFYHSLKYGQSMHTACAPLILQSEQGVNFPGEHGVYKFVNMKFGVILSLGFTFSERKKKKN